MVGAVGTIMAMLGGLIALVSLMESGPPGKGFAIGVVLLFAGLMLRIEQAVHNVRGDGDT